MDEREERRLHESMQIVGLRATGTAIGFFGLAAELLRAGVIDDEALERIKEAMVKELCLDGPPGTAKEEYEQSIRRRLDGLFAGTERLRELPKA